MLFAEIRRSTDVKKLKHRHFERHTPNLYVFTLIETTCLKIWTKPLSKGAKKATSVDMRRSETSWLKLVDMGYSKKCKYRIWL